MWDTSRKFPCDSSWASLYIGFIFLKCILEFSQEFPLEYQEFLLKFLQEIFPRLFQEFILLAYLAAAEHFSWNIFFIQEILHGNHPRRFEQDFTKFKKILTKIMLISSVGSPPKNPPKILLGVLLKTIFWHFPRKFCLRLLHKVYSEIIKANFFWDLQEILGSIQDISIDFFFCDSCRKFHLISLQELLLGNIP